MAIVGVGWAGTRQARAIRELDQVSLECLVDSDAEHLQEKADELEVAKTYTALGDALADGRVDAVSICTPHDLHRSMAIAAAVAGKHVLVEKPMATEVAEATEMIDAAETHGVCLYVAESAVYSAMASTLREIVRAGSYVGELTFASVIAGFRAPEYGFTGRRAWLSTPERGGSGTWLLHGIHTVARLRYVLGEVDTVYMRQHRASSFTRTDIEGTMSGLLTLASGVHVHLIQSPETRLRGSLRGYRIHGDRGSLRAWGEGYEVLTDEGRETHSYPTQPLSSYAQELGAFAGYVGGESVGPTTGESERRSLAVVQAGYESAESGRPVRLRERFAGL
jgi:1,5-anhydro-D-fructose reductase (1,5-anhydro-D-mannitol-forming)